MNSLLKYTLFSLVALMMFSSCSDEKLGPTIFDTAETTVDSTKASYKFDLYLYNNFLKPYNLKFIYRMEDAGADMDYNLVPATYENSKKLAVLSKYLWFDVYAKVVSPEFIKLWGPRIIHLIGSPAYNPANRTMILGLAEGGIKISLFRVNNINTNNVDMLNEFYFKTMHHEFAHILHQTKSYPKEFNLISFKYYEPFSWQDRPERVVESLGFVSPYGSSQTREDFLEIIANYIVKTDAQWNTILDNASKGWEKDGITESKIMTSDTTFIPIDNDGIDGKAVILQKLSICRIWLRDSWGIDLDSLHAEVQKRQANINMPHLLSEIE